MSQALLEANQPRGSLQSGDCPPYTENRSLGLYLPLDILLRVLDLRLQLSMGVDIGRVLEKELNFSFLTQLFPKKGGIPEAQPRQQLQMVGVPTSLGTSR